MLLIHRSLAGRWSIYLLLFNILLICVFIDLSLKHKYSILFMFQRQNNIENAPEKFKEKEAKCFKTSFIA